MKLNEDRHFYLYAKYWYKKTDFLEDLKKIYRRVYGLDGESVELTDLLAVLTHIVHRHLFSFEHRFRTMIDNIIPQNTWRIGYQHRQSKMYDDNVNSPDYDVRIALLHAYMSILSETKKDEFPYDLGDPDFTILPKKDKGAF